MPQKCPILRDNGQGRISGRGHSSKFWTVMRSLSHVKPSPTQLVILCANIPYDYVIQWYCVNVCEIPIPILHNWMNSPYPSISPHLLIFVYFTICLAIAPAMAYCLGNGVLHFDSKVWQIMHCRSNRSTARQVYYHSFKALNTGSISKCILFDKCLNTYRYLQ